MNSIPLFLALMLCASEANSASEDEIAENREIFSCSPSTVSAGDVITLKKSSSLLDELSVFRDGENAPHFLVVQSPPAEMKPLMSTEAFAKASKVEFSVDSLTGLPWRSGATSETVFTATGKYQFFVSTALESEEGSYGCTVFFVGHKSLVR